MDFYVTTVPVDISLKRVDLHVSSVDTRVVIQSDSLDNVCCLEPVGCTSDRVGRCDDQKLGGQ